MESLQISWRAKIGNPTCRKRRRCDGLNLELRWRLVEEKFMSTKETCGGGQVMTRPGDIIGFPERL